MARNRFLTIVIPIGLVLLLLFVWKKKHPRQTTPTPLPLTAVEANAKSNKSVQAKPVLAPTPPAILLGRKALAIGAEAGLISSPLKRVDKDFQLVLAIRPREGCGPVSIAAMNQGLATLNATTLLLTIEALSGEGRPAPLSKMTLNASDLDAGVEGFEFKLHFPVPSSTVQLGLFICTDTARSGRCLDKPLLTELGTDQTRASRPHDAVYYAQYLIVVGESLKILVYPDSKGKAYKTLRQYLTLIGADGRSDMKALKVGEELGTHLLGPPLTPDGERFVLDLPKVYQSCTPSGI